MKHSVAVRYGKGQIGTKAGELEGGQKLREATVNMSMMKLYS